MPATVLAEGVLTGHPGRDFHARHLIDTVHIAPVDTDLGHAAGHLRTQAIRDGADPPPSGVDATVVAFADITAVNDEVLIVTTDGDDITALAIHADHTAHLAIRPV